MMDGAGGEQIDGARVLLVMVVLAMLAMLAVLAMFAVLFVFAVLCRVGELVPMRVRGEREHDQQTREQGARDDAKERLWLAPEGHERAIKARLLICN